MVVCVFLAVGGWWWVVVDSGTAFNSPLDIKNECTEKFKCFL